MGGRDKGKQQRAEEGKKKKKKKKKKKMLTGVPSGGFEQDFREEGQLLN
jgi:hypothetical protein